jgi:hypothetical protein
VSWSTQPRPFEQRFWEKVDRRGPDQCWLWTAALTGNGYGVIRLDTHLPRVQAHRASWMLSNGPIPDGLWVLHRCDTPRCVNPAHLFLGTRADNVQDMIAKGRQNNQRKTHCRRGHEYTPQNTRMHDGTRYCISCERLRTRLRAQERRDSREAARASGRGAF